MRSDLWKGPILGDQWTRWDLFRMLSTGGVDLRHDPATERLALTGYAVRARGTSRLGSVLMAGRIAAIVRDRVA